MYFLTFFWLNEQILGKSRNFQLFLLKEEVSGSDDSRVKKSTKDLVWQIDRSPLCGSFRVFEQGCWPDPVGEW